jgi:hypothetical protein
VVISLKLDLFKLFSLLGAWLVSSILSFLKIQTLTFLHNLPTHFRILILSCYFGPVLFSFLYYREINLLWRKKWIYKIEKIMNEWNEYS